VEYDPKKIDYAKLLDIFWANHDPTKKCSRQYMSAIFVGDDDQKAAAEQSKQKHRSMLPVQTKILPAGTFYDAEDYHQKYLLQRHPRLCHMLGVDPEGEELTRSHVLSRVNGYIGGYGSNAEFEQEWSSWGISEECADYIRQEVVRRAGKS